MIAVGGRLTAGARSDDVDDKTGLGSCVVNSKRRGWLDNEASPEAEVERLISQPDCDILIVICIDSSGDCYTMVEKSMNEYHLTSEAGDVLQAGFPHAMGKIDGLHVKGAAQLLQVNGCEQEQTCLHLRLPMPCISQQRPSMLY